MGTTEELFSFPMKYMGKERGREKSKQGCFNSLWNFTCSLFLPVNQKTNIVTIFSAFSLLHLIYPKPSFLLANTNYTHFSSILLCPFQKSNVICSIAVHFVTTRFPVIPLTIVHMLSELTVSLLIQSQNVIEIHNRYFAFFVFTSSP